MFATLLAVRRKDGAGARPADTSAADPAVDAPGSENSPVAAVTAGATAPDHIGREAAPVDDADDDDRAARDAPDPAETYAALSNEEEDPAPETLDEPVETPEWEPHPAARLAPDDHAPEITPDDAEPPIASETPPEDIWAEPTPTAMSDAAALDDDVTSTPDDHGSFSSFLDDEPAATSNEPQEEDPFATAAFEPEAAAASQASEAGDAQIGGDIPEEEPFERAGRWWFKRGSELLVYNEQSGEWVPSPTPLPNVEQPAPARFGPDSTPTQTISELVQVEPDPEPGSEPEGAGNAVAEETGPVEPTGQQGFWRCPACGAVNGSTAATCRMCFAARPAG